MLRLAAAIAPTSEAASEASWANASPYYQAVYDTLLRETPDGTIEPWLATSYQYDAARTELTLKLRTGVTFTDGTPFNAAAAAANIMRFAKGTSPDAGNLAAVKSAVAVDPTTVKITLTTPDPGIVLALSQDGGLQESPKHFGASDEKTNPVGSGPYVLDTGATVIGSKYVYTKNPHYWAPKDQHYNQIQINVYGNQQTTVNAIQGKQIDFSQLLDSSANKTIEASGYTIKQAPSNGWTGLVLADRDGKVVSALGNVKVRQAINYAINRPELGKAIGGEGATATTQIFAPATTAYDKSLDGRYPYDPAKAKQLLAEAGYPNGFSLSSPEFALGGNATAAYDLTKQQLAAVGIKINYDNANLATAVQDIGGGKWGAFVFILGASDTWSTIKGEVTNPVFNPFKTGNTTTQRLITTVQTASDAQARQAAQQLNAYLVDQAWFAPFFRGVGNFAVAPGTDVQLQPDNAYPYLWNFTPTS